ncbi:FTR1 family protein [Aurantimonas sp. VKM B-3413]|uniref:FTR1 family iron permease n=1 Tax=Aurantimonas sp. VKM B-3413 TaxID=2779401 RepID=UPI001E3CA7DB|nr:FTR1 family protein [Aurantimonas sp. VKM B-3413]MCB8838182.1 FTR1 family protein [Aurantimonas sp. VKM B-3413]
MLVTFLIAFRESLEAFLLVGILIAYLKRMDAGRYVKWIYVGVAAGVLASLLGAFVLQVVVDQFSNDVYRAYLSAGIMIAATIALTYMAIWMQKQAKAQTAHATQQLESYVTAGNVFGVAILAFISVWREGLETVLFFSALAYTGETISLPGFLVGVLAAIVLVWVLISGTRKVPLGTLFRWTSLLLIVVAAGLLGSAVNTLQGVDILPGSITPLFDLSGILPDQDGIGAFLRGLFGYNASPTLLQFAVWIAFLVNAIVLWSRSYTSTPARPIVRA